MRSSRLQPRDESGSDKEFRNSLKFVRSMNRRKRGHSCSKCSPSKTCSLATPSNSRECSRPHTNKPTRPNPKPRKTSSSTSLSAKGATSYQPSPTRGVTGWVKGAIQSTRAERPPHPISIPHIPLIELHPISLQKRPLFFLKRAPSMMLFLRIDISHQRL